MSTVIKSGETDLRVRGLSAPPAAPALSEDARRILELEARLEAAAARGESLQAEVDRLATAVRAARDEGRAEGVAAGRREAEDRSSALIDTLGRAAAEGVQAFEGQLAALEDMVGGLAAAALERIVLDPAGRRDLVLETARRAVARTFAEAVVRVEVSRLDFPDEAALRRGLPSGCEAAARDDLPSGACRLALRMGEADLDLHGQVRRLRAVLQGEAVA
jgi:flagellar biosynthesis/type III secretory pathway protein FliH